MPAHFRFEDNILYKIFNIQYDPFDDYFQPNTEQLKKSYRSIQRLIHPDKNQHEYYIANKMSSILNACYAILIDPSKQADYHQDGHTAVEISYSWAEIKECYNYVKDKELLRDETIRKAEKAKQAERDRLKRQAEAEREKIIEEELRKEKERLDREEEARLAAEADRIAEEEARKKAAEDEPIIIDDLEDEDPADHNPRRGSYANKEAEEILEIKSRRGKLLVHIKWNKLTSTWVKLEEAKEQAIFKPYLEDFAIKHKVKYRNYVIKHPELGCIFD